MEAEADNLRAKAEEGKAELDKLADLQNLRAEVAFNSALAGEGRGGAGLGVRGRGAAGLTSAEPAGRGGLPALHSQMGPATIARPLHLPAARKAGRQAGIDPLPACLSWPGLLLQLLLSLLPIACLLACFPSPACLQTSTARLTSLRSS